MNSGRVLVALNEPVERMARVHLDGEHTEYVGRVGANLLDVLADANVAVTSECGATGRCGLCRVRVVRGASLLGPIRAREREQLEDRIDAGERLACQSRIIDEGEIVLSIPDGIIAP